MFSAHGNLERLDPDHTITTIAHVTGIARDIQIDGNTVYWVDDASLDKVALDGGAVTVIATSVNAPVPLLRGLAVDATRVYWTGECGLMTAPK